MKTYSVKELAKQLGKHEETIKRWLRAGKFPGAYRNSDKEGWQIPQADVSLLQSAKSEAAQSEDVPSLTESSQEGDEAELVSLAYQAVTLTAPTEEMVHVLSVVGIRRTLEILLIMQQSPAKVKNPDGFIKKAIRENWQPGPLPLQINRQQPAKRVSDLNQHEYEVAFPQPQTSTPSSLLFYNWLEGE